MENLIEEMLLSVAANITCYCSTAFIRRCDMNNKCVHTIDRSLLEMNKTKDNFANN